MGAHTHAALLDAPCERAFTFIFTEPSLDVGRTQETALEDQKRKLEDLYSHGGLEGADLHVQTNSLLQESQAKARRTPTWPSLRVSPPVLLAALWTDTCVGHLLILLD